MTFIDWTIIAFFLGALIVIGYLFSKKNKSEDKKEDKEQSDN